MGQKVDTEFATAQAARLLDMALAILDDAEHFAAAAHVAQAIFLMREDEPTTLEFPTNFSPSWGDLIDRPEDLG